MTAAPGSPHIGIVVEGPGDGLALPVLLRLHLGLRDDYRDVLGKPVSCNGREKALMPNGLEGKVAAAAARPGCRAVMVMLDGEGDPVCTLGPRLLRRASAVSPRPVAIALADPTFEAWLCASAETLGLDGLEYDPTRDPGGALKEALKPRKYVKPTWQPRLAARMDIRLAAGRDGSLDRALRKFDGLLGRCR